MDSNTIWSEVVRLEAEIAAAATDLAMKRAQCRSYKRLLPRGFVPSAETPAHIVASPGNREVTDRYTQVPELDPEQVNSRPPSQTKRQLKEAERFTNLARASYLAGNEELAERQYQAAINYANYVNTAV